MVGRQWEAGVRVMSVIPDTFTSSYIYAPGHCFIMLYLVVSPIHPRDNPLFRDDTVSHMCKNGSLAFRPRRTKELIKHPLQDINQVA